MRLKRILTWSPVLHYNPDGPFQLHADASVNEIAAILAQYHADDPMEHAVAYATRPFSKAEGNYFMTEREYLAIA